MLIFFEQELALHVALQGKSIWNGFSARDIHLEYATSWWKRGRKDFDTCAGFKFD